MVSNLSAERIELKQTSIDETYFAWFWRLRKSNIFVFLNFPCSSFSLPLLRGWQGWFIHKSSWFSSKGKIVCKHINQCSYASGKRGSKPIWKGCKKTLGFFVEFIPKKQHLIFQIRLKSGQQERQNVHKFIPKFVLNFLTSLRSSQLHWQLRNQIAKFVANFGNSEQTSEPVRQKLCETLCNLILSIEVLY